MPELCLAVGVTHFQFAVSRLESYHAEIIVRKLTNSWKKQNLACYGTRRKIRRLNAIQNRAYKYEKMKQKIMILANPILS